MQVNPGSRIYGDIRPTADIIDEYGLEGQPPDELLVTGDLEPLRQLQEQLRGLEYRQIFSRGPLRPTNRTP